MFLEKGGGAGVLIYYDDLRTKWDVDYIEFYDLEGNLLLVSWIDRFGACQVGMDRGLLDPDPPALMECSSQSRWARRSENRVRL